MSELICPKCGAGMRSYERSGVTVDQCNECRGIFLDRGELDRLLDLEGNDSPVRPQVVDDRWSRSDHGHHDDHHSYGHHKTKKRESFWSELFDD